MSIILNDSDKQMLEIVVFGSSHPKNEFQLRKDIKKYIRKSGFGSTFIVEDFHFPKKLNKTNNSRINNSLKCQYFIESQDTGIWIFSVKGAGKGSHSELDYLLDILVNKNPKFVNYQLIKNLIYGVFEEEVKKNGKIVLGASDVLIGKLLELLPRTDQLYHYNYSSLEELNELIIRFLLTVLDEYNENYVDRICVRSLPKPMCEIDRVNKKGFHEDKIAEADYLCNNIECAIWINKKQAKNDICPKCKNDLLQFNWEDEIGEEFFLFPT